MTNLSARRAIITISLFIYAVCLSMDSICTTDGCSNWPAWGILLFGWIVMFSSFANFLWIANPLYFFSLIYFYKERIARAVILSFVSFIFGLSFVWCKYILVNESGYLSIITGTEVGYWVWISCFFSTFVAMLIYRFKVKTEL